MKYELPRRPLLLVALVAFATLGGAVAPGVGAAEQSQEQVQMSVESASADPGETVTVAVAISGDGVAGYQANLTWDPAVLRFESVEGVDMSDPVQNVNDEEGWAFVTQSQAETVDSPTVARFTFAVVGESGDATDLTFVPGDSSVNDDESQLRTGLDDGTVEVTGSAVQAAGDETDGDDGTQNAGEDGTDAASNPDRTEAGTEERDSDDDGLPTTLLAGGVAGAVVVLGMGYGLGQYSAGGGGEGDGD